MSERYQKSESLLQRAKKVIPLGAQTFSKSTTQFPFGVSPYFVSAAQGSRLWDADGNEYIDFCNGLCAITMGYNHPVITKAVEEQLREGVIFSLSHPIEAEVAEQIIELIPCAESVRFGKNGSDATTAAIRLSRAFTKKDHVFTCGYHGWHDWSIGTTTKDLGIPAAVKALSHSFKYNQLESLAKLFDTHKGEVACVIMEPMSSEFPKPGFLLKVKDLCVQNEALFVFDETITGFRFAKGGAQELFEVTPDLATLGKGISNGYPLSAIVGRADVMKLMEDIFYSFTFGGEALSLRAAKATLSLVQNTPVLSKMHELGKQLQDNLRDLIESEKLESLCSFTGHPSWIFLNFKDFAGYSAIEIKTLYLQEMFREGILTLGTFNMSASHSEEDVKEVCSVLTGLLPEMKKILETKTLDQRLKCAPLQPLFSVR